MRGRIFSGVFLLILLLAFALRVWNLNRESIWHDEGWSIRAITGVMPDDNTPPIYYAAASLLWRAGAGESPFVFRYPSVLLGVLTVALGLRLAHRWMRTVPALTAGLLIAVNPLLWEYAQEVRAYVAVPLIALLLLHAAARLLHRQPPRADDWVLVFVVQCIGLYTHNLAVPLVAWLNVALGLGWLVRRRWRRMIVWAALELVVIVVYIPWLLTQSPSGTLLNTPPQPGLNLLRDIWYSYFLPVLPQLQAVGAHFLLDTAAVAGIMALIGAVFTSRRGFSPCRTAAISAEMPIILLASHALLVPAFSTALLLAAQIDFHPRYFIAAVPGTLLLLTGVTSLFARQRTTGLPAAFTGLCFVLSAHSLHMINTRQEYQHDDFAGLAAYYATLPAEAVILLPFPTEPALQVYYARQFNIRARFINLPLYADEAAVLAALDALSTDGVPRAVEFLTWFQLPADVRGMYPCLLAAQSTGMPRSETRSFFGLATQTFTLLPPSEFRAITAAPLYTGLQLTDAAYLTGQSGAVCLRTTWLLTESTAENLSISAAIRDPLGGVMARQDAPLARPDNVGTARWQPGDTGQAYALLQLPDGVPSGAYDLTWTLYSTGQPSGLDVLDTAGNPIGKIVQVDDAVNVSGTASPDTFPEPRLRADNTGEDGAFETGLPLDLTLELPAEATADAQRLVEISLSGDGWALTQQAPPHPYARLSWHRFIVPPGSAGEAILRVNAVEIARYTVLDPPRTFERPMAEITLDAVFPGVGVLIGASLPQEVITSAAPPEVVLVWAAAGASDVPYTVFVQLLAEDGRVLAQSDAPPLAGQRPTTGWVAGEYVTDPHTLRWTITDYTGRATLIAGLYDAANGFRRVLLLDGKESAVIAEVMILASP